jgi:hypothetical protein
MKVGHGYNKRVSNIVLGPSLRQIYTNGVSVASLVLIYNLSDNSPLLVQMYNMSLEFIILSMLVLMFLF